MILARQRSRFIKVQNCWASYVDVRVEVWPYLWMTNVAVEMLYY